MAVELQQKMTALHELLFLYLYFISSLPYDDPRYRAENFQNKLGLFI